MSLILMRTLKHTHTLAYIVLSLSYIDCLTVFGAVDARIRIDLIELNLSIIYFVHNAILNRNIIALQSADYM